MKRSIINVVVMVAVGLGMSLTAQTSQADWNDMRVGSFDANWCGYAARIVLTSKRGNTWVFDGKVFIRATGQYDVITVTQYADNHLRIVRHLTGAHSGKRQWVDTYPPETHAYNGQFYVRYTVRAAGGYGSAPLGHLYLPTGATNVP